MAPDDSQGVGVVISGGSACEGGRCGPGRITLSNLIRLLDVRNRSLKMFSALMDGKTMKQNGGVFCVREVTWE